MGYQFLETSISDRVGWLEYRRPPVNAIDWTMLREIGAALKAHLDDRAVRVVVIASALEKFFSTGADLRVFQAMGPEEMREWVEICHGLVRQIRDAPKPLLGAIHGTAVGGGLEIVLNCDLRFAAEGARLGPPEINIAFIPPVGTTQSLSRLLGRPRALRFLYEGTLVTAD
jgi:enoyl-CoA hydratase/carnithine racemase